MVTNYVMCSFWTNQIVELYLHVLPCYTYKYKQKKTIQRSKAYQLQKSTLLSSIQRDDFFFFLFSKQMSKYNNSDSFKEQCIQSLKINRKHPSCNAYILIKLLLRSFISTNQLLDVTIDLYIFLDNKTQVSKITNYWYFSHV